MTGHARLPKYDRGSAENKTNKTRAIGLATTHRADLLAPINERLAVRDVILTDTRHETTAADAAPKNHHAS